MTGQYSSPRLLTSLHHVAPCRHRLISSSFSHIALAACGSEPGSKRSLALADCRLPNLSTAAQCGTLEVPEDREQT